MPKLQLFPAMVSSFFLFFSFVFYWFPHHLPSVYLLSKTHNSHHAGKCSHPPPISTIPFIPCDNPHHLFLFLTFFYLSYLFPTSVIPLLSTSAFEPVRNLSSFVSLLHFFFTSALFLAQLCSTPTLIFAFAQRISASHVKFPVMKLVQAEMP